MCGIVGYVGRADVTKTLLEALSRLEYRGYDSAGIAVLNSKGLEIRRRVGKLKVLAQAVRRHPPKGHLGIGHTRWATHGEPTEANAHPHADCTGTLAVVHNGIIENYSPLKEALLARGHKFRSRTDTEVIAHLVEELAAKQPLAAAFRAALRQLHGSYAVCLVSSRDPQRIYGARNGSPLILGLGKGEALFASDVTPILGHTRRVMYLNDQEVVELSAAGPKLTTLDGRPIRRAISTVSWSVAAAQKEGFPHFMLKEIHEQPMAIAQTLFNRLRPERNTITFDARTKRFLSRLGPQEKFVIIACGTAYHAGLVG